MESGSNLFPKYSIPHMKKKRNNPAKKRLPNINCQAVFGIMNCSIPVGISATGINVCSSPTWYYACHHS